MPGFMSGIHGFLCLRAVMRVSPPSCPASPLRATVAWQYAFGDVTPSAALAFQGTGTAFSGCRGSDRAQLGAGGCRL
jgi:hypothetical protein